MAIFINKHKSFEGENLILGSVYNEPSIQAIFIRKIVSKFDDSRSMFSYVIRHTNKKSNKYMQCPNV